MIIELCWPAIGADISSYRVELRCQCANLSKGGRPHAASTVAPLPGLSFIPRHRAFQRFVDARLPSAAGAKMVEHVGREPQFDGLRGPVADGWAAATDQGLAR